MLTDERIRELAQDHYSQAYEESLSCGQVEHLRKLRNKDTADALQELLLARQRITELEAENRDWREDSERLARFADDTNNHHFGEVVMMTQDGMKEIMKICNKHQALLEKYKTEVTP